MPATASVPPPLMTADQLLILPDDGFHQHELVRGKLVCMSPSARRPSRVGGKVLARLGTFVEQLGLGEYGGADGGFRLSSDPGTVRAPDVWFVRRKRLTPDIPEDT